MKIDDLKSKPVETDIPFDDHGYSAVEIDTDALANPDRFLLLPRKHSAGRAFARAPVVRFLEKILVPAAEQIGKRVIVVQGHKSRIGKVEQWNDLFDVACEVYGFNPKLLTLQEEVKAGNAADSWGSYQNVNPESVEVQEAVKVLMDERYAELEVIGGAEKMSAQEAALLVLSFRANRNSIKLPFTDSGWSVFMGGGHTDIVLMDHETGKPDFYGVPGNLLNTKLVDRLFFENLDNYPVIAKAAESDPQLQRYLAEFGYKSFTEEMFTLARDNVRVLQNLGEWLGMMVPWYGSTHTFSINNNEGGKQSERLSGYGDQAHSKKLGQSVAVWPRVTFLEQKMIEG